MSNERFPESDADLGGDYARDTHRGAYGDDYAREGEVGGAARGDSHAVTKPDDDAPSIGKASE